MKRRLLVPAVCALLVLPAGVLAACGGDDDEDQAATATTTPERPSATTPPVQHRDDAGRRQRVKVSMKDIKYIPREVEVSVGDTVVWTNDDPIPHTVTAEKGETFDSGNVDGGDTYEYTPRKAGEISYVCTIHPNQTGTLTVTE